MNYLIWSFEHNGWWCPDRCGYCATRAHAGVYSFEEAQAIVAGANYDTINEAMVPVTDHLAADAEPHR